MDKEETHQSVLKSSLITSGVTILSRIVGLVREQVRGYYLGTGMESDAFGVASTIPNMLRRMFAEGAMTAAFVPVFTSVKSKNDHQRLSNFFSGFLSLFIILMIVVTLLGILFSEFLVNGIFARGFAHDPQKSSLTVGLTQVMFPYLFLVSIAAIVQGALNSFRIFAPSAFSPILMSLMNIAVVVFFHEWFPNPAWALAVGFLIGGILQLGFQIPFLRNKGINFRFTLSGISDPAVWQVIKIFIPGIFSAGIYQINVTIAQLIATTLDPGSVASLQYSLRMQELVLGVFAVSVATVALPTMSEQVNQRDFSSLKDTLLFSTSFLAFITIPASVGMIILGEYIIKLLFQYGRFDEGSTRMTVFALYFHSSGIFFIALQRNVVQVFYAMKDLKTPTIVAGVVMVIHAFLCVSLSYPLRHGGIALAGSLGALVNTIVLYWILRKRIGRLHLRSLAFSLGKTVVSTTVMALFVGLFLLLGFFEDSGRVGLAIRLLSVIIGGIMLYLLVSWFMGANEVRELMRLARRYLTKIPIRRNEL